MTHTDDRDDDDDDDDDVQEYSRLNMIRSLGQISSRILFVLSSFKKFKPIIKSLLKFSFSFFLLLNRCLNDLKREY